MDLNSLYSMLRNAIDYHHFMYLNQKIIDQTETESLTNSRKNGKMSALTVKNKLLQFINKTTK